ncbi:MAG TPA: hypothetical protein VLC10_01430 [Patescibacteria group bacterium]|nr:hypothetical protein [Patescibacteria group bacterium]
MHPVRALLDVLLPAAQAHEKWFVPLEPVRYAVPEFYRTLNPYTITAAAAVLVVAVAGYFADRWYEHSAQYAAIEAKIRPWRDYAAPVLAMTTGFTLLFVAWRGQLLATNYPLPPGIAGTMLRSVEAVIGGLLLVGLFTPAAAIGLLALFGAAFLLHPLIEPLDYANFVGIAVFLLFFARGRYSLDWFLGKPIFTTPAQRKWAYLVLRTLTGFTILWLGFLKWRRPDLHLDLLDRFPSSNPYVILQALGIGMSRELYVFILFAVEATIGIFEMLGFLTRATAVFLAPVFLVSIFFLGAPELVGHLPILGTLFVLFVYGDTYHKNRDAERYGIRKTPG